MRTGGQRGQNRPFSWKGGESSKIASARQKRDSVDPDMPVMDAGNRLDIRMDALRKLAKIAGIVMVREHRIWGPKGVKRQLWTAFWQGGVLAQHPYPDNTLRRAWWKLPMDVKEDAKVQLQRETVASWGS